MLVPAMEPLPIDPHVPGIAQTVAQGGHAVVVAPPGAGKTTRVPPALLSLGRVILLQPRRVAARSLARRIAAERGWTVGEEIGWQVRFERRFGPRTRLLVATEGILTARLQADPLLSDFAVAVIDEFHERSLHADLALALARQAALARDDFHIVVMSATLDAAPVAAFLGGCPVIDVPGRPFPIEISHAPDLPAAAAVRETLRRPGGHLLVFLPGAPEIRRLSEELARTPLPSAPSSHAELAGERRSLESSDRLADLEPPGDSHGTRPGVIDISGDSAAFRPATDRTAVVLPLHGSLDAAAQDAALAPSRARKVILATNIAETSLTVEGVTDVIDTGLHKVLRYDPGSGLDRLETERIPLDSADQRSGRAGRTGPGRALRLWDPRALLRPHREPEIERVDLAGPFLEVLTWGGDPLRFEWFDPPPPDRAAAALDLLEGLGAMSGGRVTPLGRTLRRFPLHPRLARVLVDACRAGGTHEAAAVCAVLAESWTPTGPAFVATDSDVILRAGTIETAPWSVRNAASELASLAKRVFSDEELRPRTVIGPGGRGMTSRNGSSAISRSRGGSAGTGDATGIDGGPSETPPGIGARRDVLRGLRATDAGRSAFPRHRGTTATGSDPIKPGTRVDRDDTRLTDFHSPAAPMRTEKEHRDATGPGDTATSALGCARGSVLRGSRGETQSEHRPAEPASRATDEPLLKALLAGFPDRVAKRREPASSRLLLFNGQGAVLDRESGVLGGDWLLALDVRAPARGQGPDAIVRAASLIDRDWLSPTGETVEHALDAASGAVRAIKQVRYGALVLSEAFVKPDPGEAARLLAAAIRARGLGDRERALLLRVRFAGIEWDENGWIERACTGRSSLATVDLASAVPAAVMAKLDRLAPETIPVPSGRNARLEYREDGTVAASVKLQELFGLAETPRVGPRREPVTLLLLAPNGRPVQTTRDLRSFWDRIYPEVRKELRGRYPKHPWPEDPWSASPTHRTKPRR